ncbi:MAG: N-acetylmuramoyl-L-alanine amidase [Selenomonadaceae bacterium]|nr:N-acetylmuramoyl-L-alanine amidase [Selenomonadaceae bacterium]
MDSSKGVYVSLEPANSSEKKDARVVVDVKKVYASLGGGESSMRLRDFDERLKRDGYDISNGYFKRGGGRGGHVIVIDPGHGGSDTGAVGPTGVSEKSVSLAVSLKAQKLLTAEGYRVIMTRTTDIDVAAPGVPDGVELQARVDKSPPDTEIFISVHCNAFSNANSHGMETFHAPTAVQGKRLATLLNEELERLGGLYNRGVKGARFYVMTHSKCPASLIELGFITNPREEKLLASSDYQYKLAQAITNAVNRYFNQGGSN